MSRLKKSNSSNFAAWNEVIGSVTLPQLQANGLPATATADDLTGRVIIFGTKLEFDTVFGEQNEAVKVGGNTVINFWKGADGDGFVQMFSMNLDDGTITALGSKLEYDTDVTSDMSAFLLDITHVCLFWRGTDGDGFAQVFSFDSAGLITALSTKLEFTTSNAQSITAFKVTELLVMNFYEHVSDDGLCQLYDINATTFAITKLATAFTFDSTVELNSGFLLDQSHVVNFWRGAIGDGFVRMFSIDSAGAIAGLGSTLEFDGINGDNNTAFLINDTTCINFWRGGVGTEGVVQLFRLDAAAGTVVALDSKVAFDTVGAQSFSAALLSPTRAVCFWQNVTANHGFAQMFDFDTTTGVVEALRQSIDFEGSLNDGNSVVKMSNNRIINFWEGASSDGFAQIFKVE